MNYAENMRHGGDDMRRRGEPYLNCYERDRLIVALRRKGWSHERICRYPGIGMSRRGVGMALERIAEGREGRSPRP
jgi:hypothetical protein